MTDTVVRRLAPSEASQYRALMLEAYTRSPEAFTSLFAERESPPIQWWEARLADEPNALERVYGAFVGDELVGVAGLSIEQRERARHEGTPFGMYVREASRSQGVGRRLVERVLRQVHESDRIEVVQLTVSEPNRTAIDLYARCGFVPFGTEPMAVKTSQGYISEVHL